MKIFKTPNGTLILAHIQWIESVRQTTNGYAFDIHLKGEICNLAFDSENEALYTFDELMRILMEAT